jgi:hypothetical protein
MYATVLLFVFLTVHSVTSEGVSDRVSEAVSDRVSEAVSDRVSEAVSDRVSDRVSEAVTTISSTPNILNLNSSCYDKTSCEDCVGTTFSPNSGCVWCGTNEACQPDSLSCSDGDDKNTCSNEYFVVIFVIVMSALLFLCCISCLLRKYNVREDGSLRVPLLGNDRNYLFRNSLFDSGEAEWMCIMCGFDNRPRNKDCSMCGTSQDFCVEYKKEKKDRKKMKKMKYKEFSKEKVEILIPEEKQVASTPPRVNAPPMATMQTPMSPRTSLSSSERQQAFNYRRLNQLTLRQKSTFTLKVSPI